MGSTGRHAAGACRTASLVVELPVEFAGAGVSEMPAEPALAVGHAGTVEVLDSDHVEPSG